MSADWRKSYKPNDQEPPKEPEACSDSGDDECSGNCETCPAAATATEQERQFRLEQKRLEERTASIKHQILIISGKGGVGKSTVAANLGWGLAMRDRRVGVLDADLHGPTIPIMMGLAGQHAQSSGDGIAPVPVFENLLVMSMSFLTREQDDPLIWRGPLRSGVIRQFIADVDWGALDYLIADLPPGTGDEPLTVAQSFPDADGAIIVTTPQEVSTADCRKAANFVKRVNLPILGVVENMSGFVCPHCNTRTDIFSEGGGRKMAEQFGVPLLGTIPIFAEITELGDQGRPILGPGAPEPVRKAYTQMIDALLEAIEGNS